MSTTITALLTRSHATQRPVQLFAPPRAYATPGDLLGSFLQHSPRLNLVTNLTFFHFIFILVGQVPANLSMFLKFHLPKKKFNGPNKTAVTHEVFVLVRVGAFSSHNRGKVRGLIITYDSSCSAHDATSWHLPFSAGDWTPKNGNSRWMPSLQYLESREEVHRRHVWSCYQIW